MKKWLLFLLLFFLFPSKVFAQNQPIEKYYKAEVIKVINEGKVENSGHLNLYQDLQIKILDGSKIGESINLHYGDPQILKEDQKLQTGDKIILLESNSGNKPIYMVYDKYRLSNIFWVLALFILLVVLISGLKGIGSLIGLGISLGVILFFIVPQILNGHDPLLISLIGSMIILFFSTYVAHGVSKQTSVALASTLIGLIITATFAVSITTFSKITGIGNEDVASLQMGATSIINLKGLFLAGIIIGTLGALNDVTISQSATIFELARTEPAIKLKNLIKKSFSIGREHILSLVNTLVLAYAGSALFIFIFIVLNPAHVPYWVILNTETISGEIVSTIVGSSGLILTVPIVTILASYIALRVINNKTS